MFPYWWRLFCVGIWQQDAYVHNDAEGYGIARHMQQLMESIIELAKREARNRCNKLHGWVTRLQRFLDCYCVGVMGHDVIDFKHPMHKYLKEMSLIYLPTTTPMIEENLITRMPQRFVYYLTLMEEMQHADDAIPELLEEAWNQHVRQNHDLDELRGNIEHECKIDRGDNFSGWLQSIDGDHEVLIRRRAVLGRTQWMQELQARTYELDNNNNNGEDNDNASVSSVNDDLFWAVADGDDDHADDSDDDDASDHNADASE